MIQGIPDISDKRLLADWLIKNKQLLITQKKSAIKYADAVSTFFFVVDKDDNAIKANPDQPITEDATKIKVRSIINTTKLFDSHGDVHIDQLWNKSIKENSNNYLVKEHNFSFDGIISDNVKVMTKQYTWKELMYNYEGSTQALVYDSVIDKADSPDMFGRYAAGKVKQHSVGMRYVKMDFAINDDRYEKEYAVWQKYFDSIANKDDVLEVGYFWPVTEAKNIEGSAVVRGSNFATPTQSIQQVKGQPLQDTDEPEKSTLNADKLLKYYEQKLKL